MTVTIFLASISTMKFIGRVEFFNFIPTFGDKTKILTPAYSKAVNKKPHLANI